MTKPSILFLLAFVIVFATAPLGCFAYSKENLDNSYLQRVSNAYGYLIGQDYSLRRVSDLFPKYKYNIAITEMKFGTSFGLAKSRMKEYLINSMGASLFMEYENTVVQTLKNVADNQILTEESSLIFLAEIENRAKGNIPTPILETLLSFQFSDEPHEEFMAGFTTIFKTKNHPKSKFTDWQIRVPKSWRSEEADRPNIIQKFTSEYGSGSESVMLMVNFTNQDPEDFFTPEAIKQFIPKGGKYLSFKKMVIDQNSGGLLEYELISTRLDKTFKARFALYIFIRNKMFYVLQCSVITDELDADLESKMGKYQTLYKLIANSIIVNDQYK